MVLNENIIFHKINNEKQANIKIQQNKNPTYNTYLKKEETGIIKKANSYGYVLFIFYHK